MKYAAFITAVFVATVMAQGPQGRSGPPNGPPNGPPPGPPPPSITYETITTTALTTYCPLPTTFVHNEITYTVTTATTLTITDCPCTLVRPWTPPPTPLTWYYTSCAETSPTTTPIVPPPCTTCHNEVVSTTSCTEPTETWSASGTPTWTQPPTQTSGPIIYTGAAEKRGVIGGVVVGMAGLVAGLVL